MDFLEIWINWFIRIVLCIYLFYLFTVYIETSNHTSKHHYLTKLHSNQDRKRERHP